jgi:DNA-binding MarR family transcriptional regulator
MPDDESVTEQDADQKVRQKILQVLESKGAVLPVELAVQTYSFPEEIAGVVSSLEQEGLIERQALKAGEMIVLTQKGQEQSRAGPA